MSINDDQKQTVKLALKAKAQALVIHDFLQGEKLFIIEITGMESRKRIEEKRWVIHLQKTFGSGDSLDRISPLFRQRKNPNTTMSIRMVRVNHSMLN